MALDEKSENHQSYYSSSWGDHEGLNHTHHHPSNTCWDISRWAKLADRVDRVLCRSKQNLSASYLWVEAARLECWPVRGPLVGCGYCCSWCLREPMAQILDWEKSRSLGQNLDLDPNSGLGWSRKKALPWRKLRGRDLGLRNLQLHTHLPERQKQTRTELRLFHLPVSFM